MTHVKAKEWGRGETSVQLVVHSQHEDGALGAQKCGTHKRPLPLFSQEISQLHGVFLEHNF